MGTTDTISDGHTRELNEKNVIVIQPKDYRERLKEYALRLAEQFDRNITVEIDVDKVNKSAIIKVIVHRF